MAFLHGKPSAAQEGAKSVSVHFFFVLMYGDEVWGFSSLFSLGQERAQSPAVGNIAWAEHGGLKEPLHGVSACCGGCFALLTCSLPQSSQLCSK